MWRLAARGPRDLSGRRRLRASGFRPPPASLDLGLGTVAHFQPEKLREVAAGQDLLAGGSLPGQREAHAGLGDEVLLVHRAKPEEKLGLLVEACANAVEDRRDVLAHRGPVRTAA